MNQRVLSFVGIAAVLLLGNFLLTWYLLQILGAEGAAQMANLRQYQENELIAEVEGRVETACTMVRYVMETTPDTAQAQKSAMEAVSKIRFGENNYVWIHLLNPEDLRSAVMLVHPADTLRGHDLAYLVDTEQITHVYYEGEIIPKTDPRVRFIGPSLLSYEFNRIALDKGEGTFSYYWPKIVDGKPTSVGYRKVAFVKYFPEWRWVLGAGAYADNVDLAMKERADQLRRHHAALVWRVAGAMAGFSIGIVFVVSFLGWRVARRQIKELKSEVDERTRAEEALRASEERYRTLFESASDAIITREIPSLRLASCNQATVKMFRARKKEDLISLYTWDLSKDPQPDGRRAEEKAREMIDVALREGSCSLEWVYRRLDGQEFPATVSVTRMEIAGQTVLQIAVRDISEYKLVQEQLIQAQKMESIGRLAGGVAHDFNNLLAVILGYGEMLETDLPEDSPLREDVKQITAAGKRAKDLTQQLLAFSRKQVLEMRTVDVNALITGMETMLRRLLGETIEIRIVLDSAPASVNADPAQLEQVLMNLCVNARDAMPEGGTLAIETGSVFLDDQYVQTRPNIAAGYYVVFSVTDTGSGMDKETLRQVFDPFFTTKGAGKGTGLGLATVYGIVKQHGGDISVYSEPGCGSTFRIYLPRTQPFSQDHVTPEEETALGKGETVLVLEDDPSVRELTVKMVSRLGYAVLEARDAEECLAFARSSRRIDLLLTDVILPGLNGKQVRDLVVEIRPEIKVVFMSGYSEDIIIHHGVLDPSIHFINKPFSTTDLGLKLREALEGG